MLYGLKRKGNKTEKKKTTKYEYSDSDQSEKEETDKNKVNNKITNTNQLSKPINKFKDLKNSVNSGFSTVNFYNESKEEADFKITKNKISNTINQDYTTDDSQINRIIYNNDYLEDLKRSNQFTQKNTYDAVEEDIEPEFIQEDDFYSGNYEEVPGSVYNDKNSNLTKEINKIKKIREVKRETGHKQEKYDQDFLENQNTHSKDVIGDIYNILEIDQEKKSNNIKREKIQDDESDSDQELKHWEMSKINQGLSTHWVNPKKTDYEKPEKIKKNDNGLFVDIKEKFKIKFDVDFDEILKDVSKDVDATERRLNSFLEKKREIEKFNNEFTSEKNFIVEKIDYYVSQYRKFSEIYSQTIHEYKINKNTNLEIYSKHFKDLDLDIYISDEN